MLLVHVLLWHADATSHRILQPQGQEAKRYVKGPMAEERLGATAGSSLAPTAALELASLAAQSSVGSQPSLGQLSSFVPAVLSSKVERLLKASNP